MKSLPEKSTGNGFVDVYPRFVDNDSFMGLIESANQMIQAPRETPKEYEEARDAAVGSVNACLAEASLNSPSDVVGVFYRRNPDTDKRESMDLVAFKDVRFVGIGSVAIDLTEGSSDRDGIQIRKFTREVLSFCFRQDLPDGSSEFYDLPIDKGSILGFYMEEYASIGQESPGVDLLETLFADSQFSEKVVASENALRCAHPDEIDRLVSNVIREINTTIPDRCRGMMIDFSGNAYEYNDFTEEYELSKHDHADANFYGSAVLEIDGVDRIVMKLGVTSKSAATDTDNNIHDEVYIYVIPDKQHVKKFNACNYSDDTEYELVDVLRAYADRMRTIIMSKDFMNSGRDHQIETLEAIIVQADEALNDLREAIVAVGRLSCSANKFACIIAEIREHMTPDDLKQNEREADGDIEVDEIWIDMPELDLPDDKSFWGPRDFKYSGGEPVLYMADNEKGLIYTVRFGDIESLIPVWVA